MKRLTASVLALNLVAGCASSAPTATPPPALIARGTLVDWDWGRVEFEATRTGAAVTGHMSIGEGRGAGWPLTVEFECARTAEDGLVLIGGIVTRFKGAPPLAKVGTRAAIAVKQGQVARAEVWVNGLIGVPATLTTDCLGYLDGWLAYSRDVSPTGDWEPHRARGDEGTIQFGV